MRLLQFSWERLLNVYYVEENVGTENCLNKLLPEYTEAFKFKMVDDDVANDFINSAATLIIITCQQQRLQCLFMTKFTAVMTSQVLLRC